MSKLFLNLFFFLVLSTSAFAQKQTLFLDTNYDTALAQSKKENKPIAIMFYANWCAHCKKMKEEIFMDADVIKFYSTSYICIAVDAESAEGIALKNKLQSKFLVKSYPTFAFIDSNENLLYCIAGEFKKDIFILEGTKALVPENQFTFIKEKFNADNSNAENCLRYIIVTRKAGFDATSITQNYLKTKSEAELFTELNWKILANGINNIQAKEVPFIVAKKEEFAKVVTLSRIEKKLVYMVSDNLKPLADLGDTLRYNKVRPIAASFQIRKVDSLLFRYDLTINEYSQNWKNYKKTSETLVEKFAWKDSNALVEICNNYLTHIEDKKSLDFAITCAKQALTLGESLDKYLLIVKLYTKEKDYTNALLYANNAKTIATNFGWKTENLDKLLVDLKKH
ncbi:thioredoxin family protein [Flavobacterium sp.]|jgi:thioredoxin-related protein|uniref:thioredoxin family protein n=1 Tax=Flavobacterium sp. TaxID=239 RepID=UPI0037C0A283